MAASKPQIGQLLGKEYQASFITGIDIVPPPGLSESVIRLISAKKQELQFSLDWRLKAYRHWQSMQLPEWSSVHYSSIDHNAISYFSPPVSREDATTSLEEIDQNTARDLCKAKKSADRTGITCRFAVDEETKA